MSFTFAKNGSLRVALLALGSLTGCSASTDLCGNQVAVTKPSPDGRHAAVLFQRDCGATTGPSTQISIVEVGREPIGAGNVFIADDDHGAAKPAAWGGPWAAVSWIAANRLSIRFDARSRILAKADARSGVAISFQGVRR